MESITSYGLLLLSTGSTGGGLFFEGLLLLPIAFIALILFVVGGSFAAKSRVDKYSLVWPVSITVVSAALVSLVVRRMVTVPAFEVELVTVSSTLAFPFGIAARRRDWLSTGAIAVSTALLIYAMNHVFSNTFGEVLALTLGSGFVFFLLGYRLNW